MFFLIIQFMPNLWLLIIFINLIMFLMNFINIFFSSNKFKF